MSNDRQISVKPQQPRRCRKTPRTCARWTGTSSVKAEAREARRAAERKALAVLRAVEVAELDDLDLVIPGKGVEVSDYWNWD